jgi:flagellar basal-body rod modification protein FlgD
MMINAVPGSPATVLNPGTKTGYAALGQGDFLKLMTTQLQQQDPTSPVDSKEMLAQLAQFQSLGGINDINTTLQSIASKLDAVLAAQASAQAATNPAAKPTA